MVDVSARRPAGPRAEGAKPPGQHHRAYEAAHAKYLELALDAPSDRLTQLRIVTTMIANAIRMDMNWFLHGLDR